MFNSITVNLLYKFWSKIEYYYKFSIIKVILDKLSKIGHSLLTGSLFINFLTNDRSYYEDSLLFKLYSSSIDKLNMFFDILKKMINRYKKSSIFYLMIDDSVKDNKSINDTIFISLIIFSITSLILNFDKDISINITIIIGILLIVSTFILLAKVNVIDTMKNSVIVNLVQSVFSVDEGDDKWW